MKLAMLIACTALAALAGCAPGNYVDPAQNLRTSSLNAVNAHARSVAIFLREGGTEDQAIEKGKEGVVALLKDPDSAKFRNVALKPFGDGKVVCGEVNAKNSYGGYVGFRGFAAGAYGATLEETGGRYAEVDRIANTGLTAACGY